MKDLSYHDFTEGLGDLKRRAPLFGQIELTYRCPCNCIHCYCANQPEEELDPSFWKGVLDQIHALGGIEVTFTGGDPLVYPGFPEVYRHAKKKGFLINIFTSGCHIDEKTMDLLVKNPPLGIEITLNSLDKDNYERITRTSGVFDAVMRNIRKTKKRGLPLVLKCNGLKENREEVLKIKRFAEELLGKGKFKFDSFVFPGLDGDAEPKQHRLEPYEIIDIEKSDSDMIAQRQEQLGHQSNWFNPEGLYHCNTWFNHYFIDPRGVLQFCHLTDECSTDLKKETFKNGFNRFPDMLKLRYKTDSKCINCELRMHCYKCPARAFLETGDAEAPVGYYCRLAEARVRV